VVGQHRVRVGAARGQWVGVHRRGGQPGQDVQQRVLLPTRMRYLATSSLPANPTSAAAATALMPSAAAKQVTVAVPRAAHLVHASILREGMRLRTSAITGNEHMRNERNNWLFLEAVPRAAKRVASGLAIPPLIAVPGSRRFPFLSRPTTR